MSPEVRRRAKTVFAAVLNLPTSERESYLAQVAGEDAELRKEVRSLLATGGPETADFERAIASASAEVDRSDLELLGQTIGRFRIDRLLARGGMGLVFEATQIHPRRTVALKILRGRVTSPEALRRFRGEVRALARLRHPAIAQIYDAGTCRLLDTRIQFFAMEYVFGARPLTRYANENALGIRERLTLVADLCEAMQHGHEAGIIHRDLKPDNVLVDRAGHVKVIDFGVARAVHSNESDITSDTIPGQLLGTVQYMSPEQCEGSPNGLDARTDVYSIGVILYELVCGRLPYDVAGLSIPAAVVAVREAEPIRPGAVQRELRGPIEAIVLKSLRKNREERYVSAANLGRDIRRHLAGRRVEASVPGLVARSVASLRRRPVLTTNLAYASAAAILIAAATLAMRDEAGRPRRAGAATSFAAPPASAWLVATGPDVLVNAQNVPHNQSASKVSMSPVGGVIVWEDSSDQRGRSGVFGQRLDSDGNPVGEMFCLGDDVRPTRSNPVVAMDRTGIFVAVWKDGKGVGDGDGLDGSGHGVIARRFDATGSPLGDEFVVNTNNTQGDQHGAAIAMKPDGEFVIAWTDLTNFEGAPGADVYARRYAPDGTPLCDPFLVNTTVIDEQDSPSIAMNEAGAFVIAWRDSSTEPEPNRGSHIAAQKFDASNVPIGDPICVSPFHADDMNAPGVAIDVAGDFIVVWDSLDDSLRNVRGRRFDRGGHAIADEFLVNDLPIQAGGGFSAPVVEFVSPSGYVVAWCDRRAADNDKGFVLMKRFDGDGVVVGETLEINSDTDGEQAEIAISTDFRGRFVFTWTGLDAMGTGIRARWFARSRRGPSRRENAAVG